MARVSTYLNFARSTEEVFLFYRSVFGTEFTAPIARLGDMPTPPGQPPLAETERLFKARTILISGEINMGWNVWQSCRSIRRAVDVQLR